MVRLYSTLNLSMFDKISNKFKTSQLILNSAMQFWAIHSNCRVREPCFIFIFVTSYLVLVVFTSYFRLRVVSNFGDCDCGAGKIYTRARESSRRRDAKGAPNASRLLEISRARVCILPAPQSPSPKLETTRSLLIFEYCRLSQTSFAFHFRFRW